jgi:hypothetical protein
MSRATVLAQLRRAREDLAEAKAALAAHERGDPSLPGYYARLNVLKGEVARASNAVQWLMEADDAG